ncbi:MULTISPECIES: PH domain-containing protein [unclassified Streptomyces]|uniref:PH domain-containing protein n=1 Tax=unclassified Streptomyces TaxID=2593676 RepID=UPI00371BA369
MQGDGVERVYRKRRKPARGYVAAVGALMVNALLQVTEVSGRLRLWGGAVTGGIVVVLLARMVLNQYRACTRVTVDGITARGPVRSRTWAWREVYDIQVERDRRAAARDGEGGRLIPGPGDSGMFPRWRTYLYDFEGRRVLLPQLDDWQWDDPHAEVARLRQAALPYREGLPWGGPEDADRYTLRRAVRRARRIRQAGLTVTALIVAALVVLLR